MIDCKRCDGSGELTFDNGMDCMCCWEQTTEPCPDCKEARAAENDARLAAIGLSSPDRSKADG